MNNDMLRSRWTQVKGQLRLWWNKLTDEDVEKIAGKTEVLIGMLQTRYGYTRERALAEIEQRLKEFEAPVGSATPH